MLQILRVGVASVHAEVCTSHVGAGVAGQEGDGTHEVLGPSHLTLRDERRPLARQLGVVFEDLLRTSET
jgi:hypothetical protein